jgi:SAM-dependent methyltransferase
MSAKVIEANWYDFPQYYDLAFRSDTKPQADFLEAVARTYCDFPVRRLLEPACGSGRLVAEMSSRGYEVTGFDLSRQALAYARRRLKRRGLQATLCQADMREFRLPGTFDLAYNFVNTFRHLLTEEEARRHLELVAEHLRPGGLYVVGFHLFPPDADNHTCERWVERWRQHTVSVTIRVLHTDRRRRLELLRMSMLVRSPRGAVRLRTDFYFRLYSAVQLRQLLATVPQLELVGTYDFWYCIDEPVVLSDEIEDVVLVLRRRSETSLPHGIAP